MKLWLDCDCLDPSHVVKFQYNEDLQELWVTTCLKPGESFWYRLQMAWNFVLGREGNAIFETTILDLDSVHQLKNFVNSIDDN